MRVSFQPLHQQSELRRLLRADGWMLEGDLDALIGEHPDATDQPSARSRLHRLGLLTSRGLRIEFMTGDQGFGKPLFR
jgi:hypothetical protein